MDLPPLALYNELGILVFIMFKVLSVFGISEVAEDLSHARNDVTVFLVI